MTRARTVTSPVNSVTASDTRGTALIQERAEVAVPADLPGVCPVCGGRSILPEGSSSALVAVCDVLVVKALEQVGKWIVRAERSRFRTLGTRPWQEAHTIWQPDESVITKALRNAWDVVPALLDTHGCCGVTSRQVTEMLDSYVHDLTITGTPHHIREMAYRFETRLGLPVYLRHEHRTNHASRNA